MFSGKVTSHYVFWLSRHKIFGKCILLEIICIPNIWFYRKWCPITYDWWHLVASIIYTYFPSLFFYRINMRTIKRFWQWNKNCITNYFKNVKRKIMMILGSNALRSRRNIAWIHLHQKYRIYLTCIAEDNYFVPFYFHISENTAILELMTRFDMK